MKENHSRKKRTYIFWYTDGSIKEKKFYTDGDAQDAFFLEGDHAVGFDLAENHESTN